MKYTYINIHRKCKSILITAILIIIVLFTSNISQLIVSAIDPDLEESQVTQNNHFIIYWTDCVPTDHLGKCEVQAKIDDLDFVLEDLFDIYTDPTNDYKFNDPTSGTAMDVEVRPADMGGIAYYDGWIAMDPDIFNNWLSTEAIRARDRVEPGDQHTRLVLGSMPKHSASSTTRAPV